MELRELKRKLQLELDFDEKNLCIRGKIIFQDEGLRQQLGAIRAKHIFSFDKPDFTIYSAAYPHLYDDGLAIRGTVHTSDDRRIHYYASSKRQFNQLKKILLNFTCKKWSVKYSGEIKWPCVN